MWSRSRLSRALLRSVAQRRFSRSAATATTLAGDEVNLARPRCAGLWHGALDQNVDNRPQWGSAWLVAATGLMALSSTSLVNSSSCDAKQEKEETAGVVDRPSLSRSSQKPRVIFVLGGPGSGKGTQCAKIVDNYGFVHLSAGDLLRAEIKSGSPNGNMIQNMIKEGKIVPSEVTVKLLEKAMKESKNDKFLIDGFPRNEENRAAFENVAGITPEFVLFFDCPEEELEKRLLGRNEGRVDDNIDTIRKRFKVFIESSLPVIEHYGSIGKVRKINAAKPKDEVFDTIEPLFRRFVVDDLLRATNLLLQGIDSKDFELYKDLCSPELTAFEPEAAGQLVEGLDFHKYYFDKTDGIARFGAPSTSTIISPKVTLLGGGDVGLVTYTRLVRDGSKGGTKAYNETRVWERRVVDGESMWKNIHFHRSSLLA